MGTNSAGNVSSGNNGKTDNGGRGATLEFPYTKGQRNTGKVSGSPSSKSNSVKPDDMKTTVRDPRLA
jgi:hypothetical protein